MWRSLKIQNGAPRLLIHHQFTNRESIRGGTVWTVRPQTHAAHRHHRHLHHDPAPHGKHIILLFPLQHVRDGHVQWLDILDQLHPPAGGSSKQITHVSGVGSVYVWWLQLHNRSLLHFQTPEHNALFPPLLGAANNSGNTILYICRRFIIFNNRD